MSYQYISTLNDEEQALIPFKINPLNYIKPLFEYTSYTTSVGYYLLDGVQDLFSEEDTIFINAVRCSLVKMLLRTSRKLKNLTIRFDGVIRDKTIKELCRNTTIVSLSIDNMNNEPFGS
ncbi:hypothetical protein C2G38_2240173 [Gigaspora rosea]|uniref:Uncharacterized protein n=1 Tax=Gigaspora rosea TaxID=44941 RepID=A0A397W523_9GLOM|nr:hypothetical protein C2G38_2240173 [Gigaspora rosea]